MHFETRDIYTEQQRKILQKLMYSEAQTFNQLWNKEGDSNKTAYSLKRLSDLGLVQKIKLKYFLTETGKALSAFLDNESGKTTQFPTVAHLTVIWNKNKVLAQERLKEPFKGYFSFPSGKIVFGTSIEESAKKDVFTETGIALETVRQKGIEEIKTFDNGVLLYHHVMFVFEAFTNEKQFKNTQDGNHFWLAQKEYVRKNIFPPVSLSELLNPKLNFFISKGERYMKDGKFTHAKVIQKIIM